MKPWNEVAASVLPEGFDIMDWSFPVHDAEAFARGRALCTENKCGSYGCSWGCPPGCDLTVEKVSKDYSRVGVVKKRYEVDFSDKTALDKLGDDLQTYVRNIVLALRKEGYKSMALPTEDAATAESAPTRNPAGTRRCWSRRYPSWG